MGDVVSATSHFIKHLLKSDCHLIHHFPPKIPTYDYEDLIPDLMSEWSEGPYKLTHEVDTSWYSIKPSDCVQHFGNQGKSQPTTSDVDPLWFYRDLSQEQYWPFKTQWLRDYNGPIAIAPNHEFFIKESYPKGHLFDKFFTDEDNDFLLSLIDGKNFIHLGTHYTFKQNIEIMSKCRYVLGVEGGWTHISNAMDVPFIIVANKRGAKAPLKVHSGHRRLRVIETNQMREYLTL